MAIEFKLPGLGENVEGGDLVNVLVKEGDQIQANQDVFEIETGKAVLPVPCPHAGRIGSLKVKKGDHVKVGQVVLTVEEGGASSGNSSGGSKAQPTAAAKPNEDAESTDEWTVPSLRPAPAASQEASATIDRESMNLLPAGPSARRIARELGVDLRSISGSGPRGRITPEDVKVASQAPTASPGGAAPQLSPLAASAPAVTLDDRYGPVRREPLTQIRKAIAAQMSRSSNTIPHVTNFDDVDITELERLRKGVKPGQLGENVKLTLMPFVMKAIALSLKEHPLVNSSLDDQNLQIVYKDYVNLGIAVDTPRGLIVPVIKGVDQLSIPDLARKLHDVAQRARAAQFTLDELRGGTFTISNLGAVGGTYSTPIINYPEAAILLLGRSRILPVYLNGQFEHRQMLPLSLSYDLHLVDGAEAARFLGKVMERLLSPATMLLSD